MVELTTPKNDRGGVRTAQELERKYDLKGIQQNIKESLYNLKKVNNELEQFIKKTVGELSEIQAEIDGKVEVWFYKGEPSLISLPASEWTDKETHVNDLYYDTDTGIPYRFKKTADGYAWEEVRDKDTAKALAAANAAQDTADCKRRIFVITPSPPYDKGDLWFNEKEIYICVDNKASGQYAEGDFVIATNYTEQIGSLSKDLTAVKADIGEFKELVSGHISALSLAVQNLESNKATIKQLEALDAYIKNLEADMLTVTKADLKYASIEALNTEKGRIDELDSKKVNVDKANIDTAWIVDLLVKGKFLADSVEAATGSFSKYLTGVNIVGDNISAGTIKTDRLIIRDADSDTGILFALNNGIVEQTELSSEELKRLALDGSILVAQSVTADKINVYDLFAQNILSTGNFNMGGKGALVYDSENDQLSIRAKEITLETGSLVQTDELNETATRLEGVISQNKDDLTAAINESEKGIKEDAQATYATKDELTATKSKLEILSNQVGISVETIEKIISTFEFTELGLIIGKSDSEIKSVQDNDSYEFIDKAGNAILAINTKGVNTPTVNVEKQITMYGQWAQRRGAYVDGVGYNLNDIWIGG